MSKVVTAGMVPAFGPLAPPSSLMAVAGRLTALVGARLAARRSRRLLAGLSDQMLADVGIEPSLARPSSRYEVDARTMTGLMALR